MDETKDAVPSTIAQLVIYSSVELIVNSINAQCLRSLIKSVQIFNTAL